MTCCLLFSVSGAADDNADLQHRPHFSPYISVEENYRTVVETIMGIPLIYRHNAFSFDEFKGSYDLNFVFISAENAIISGRLDPKNLQFFQKEAQNYLSSLDTKTDHCFVQELEVGRNSNFVLAVHNLNDAQELDEDVFRCLVLALHVFHLGSADVSDAEDWRLWLTELILFLSANAKNAR